MAEVSRETDWQAAIAAEEARLDAGGEVRCTAVERLRALHEAAARQALGRDDERDIARASRAAVEAGLDPVAARRAALHLGQAERWQWEMGSWASGAGEGLSSMASVRALQLGRAWLLSSIDDEDARSLLAEVGAAIRQGPDFLARRLSRDLQALEGRRRP
jgi:hypothetical protein